MSSSDCRGCAEYMRLSRRQFMATTGGTVLAASLPAWIPRVAYAQDACTDRDVIVSIFLRGAMDGLTMCPPHTDPLYYAQRPTLAVPPPGSGGPHQAIDLDGQFGLAQPLAPLLTAYNSGDLLIVHACGSTDPSRSHFDAQRFMEVGKPADPNLFTGWLGRHLASIPPINAAAVLRAVGIAYGMPLSLESGPKGLPIPVLENFGLEGIGTTSAARLAALNDMYAAVGDPARAAAQTTSETISLLDAINFSTYVPAGGAVYPVSPFGMAMKSSAALIKAQVGVEAIAVDIEGWDTHIEQGSLVGELATKLTDLGAALGAFYADMFSGNGQNVTVVVMSEFGRRLAENGNRGTDHGHGNAMMVMGNNIAGGRILTQWPGLEPEQLFEGRDLEVTIDFRDILAEIVQHRLGNSNLGLVFPDYTPTFRGVTEACAPPVVTPPGGRLKKSLKR